MAFAMAKAVGEAAAKAAAKLTGNTEEEVRGHPDRAVFAATADAQESCAFFSKLPLEIRQRIYLEFWRIGGEGGLGQHIVSRIQPDALNPPGPLTHAPCISDHLAVDTRQEEFQNVKEYSTDKLAWARRVKTEWCTHWACEELDAPNIVPSQAVVQPRGPRWSPFLPVMLTCKRMYLECVESIYGNLTFCFTDQIVAHHFLSRYDPHVIRSIDLSINVSQLLTELYFDATRSERGGLLQTFQHGPYLTVKNNPWSRLCVALSCLTRLRSLRLWFDSPDLRHWNERVVETRFFDALSQVRVEREFLLMLPLLRDPITGAALGGGAGSGNRQLPLEGYYLEGDKLEGLPFVVQRGPRANKWLVHLGWVNQVLH